MSDYYSCGRGFDSRHYINTESKLYGRTKQAANGDFTNFWYVAREFPVPPPRALRRGSFEVVLRDAELVRSPVMEGFLSIYGIGANTAC